MLLPSASHTAAIRHPSAQRPVPVLNQGSLRWAVGAFCATMGALMFLAPHQFQAPSYALLQPLLGWWGAAHLLAGAGLLGTAALAPRRALAVSAHVLAGALLLLLAYGLASTGGWTGLTNYAALGLGTLLAPLLPRARVDQPGPAGDLFALLMGISIGSTGLLILALPGQLDAPIYVLVRPYLPWYGSAFLCSGLALTWTQLRPSPTRALSWTAHWLAAGALFILLVAVALPFRLWTGIAYAGGFGTALVLLPWLEPRVRRVDPRSLRTHLALALVVAATLPLLLEGAVGEGRDERSTLDQALALQQSQATTLAQFVAEYVIDARGDVGAVAALLGLLDLDLAEQEALLRAANQAQPSFMALATFDADGKPLARSDGRPLLADRRYGALEETRRTRAPSLDIHVGPLIDRPVFTFGAPIGTAEGSFAGVVVGVLESVRLSDLLAGSAALPGGMPIYLVDGDGRAIAHPDAALVASFADLAATPPVAALLTERDSAGAVTYGEPGRERLAGYARVPGLGWGVVAERPLAAVLAGHRVWRDLHFGILLLAVGIAAVAGMLVAAGLVAPLRALARAADGLAAGSAAPPLPRSGITELGLLADAFAETQQHLAARTAERERAEAQLQERVRAFSALHEVAVATSGVLEPGILGQLVVDHARDLVDGDAAGLFWWDREADVLRPLAHSGPGSTASLPPQRAKEGIMGQAFERCETVVVEDYAGWANAAPTGRRLGIRSAVAVPLLVNERPLGVLAVHNRTPRRFAPDQLQTLALLAAQAGPALEAARLHTETELRRAEAEAAQQRLAFIAEASKRLAASLDYEATLQRAVRLVVPALADRCVIDLVDGEQGLRQAAVAHVDPSREGLMREHRCRFPADLAGAHPVARVVRTGQPVLYSEIVDEHLVAMASDEAELQALRAQGFASAMVVPLAARGRALGTLSCLSAESHRRYTKADLALAEELAHRCALALDSAGLYQEVQKALRTRDDFLASVSHDLKSPLTVIRGRAQLLRRGIARGETLSAEMLVEGLTSVEANAAKMASWIGGLLDLAHLQASQPLALQRLPTDLVVLARQAAAVHRRTTARHAIHVEVAAAALAGRWDAPRLERVLDNLLGNAIKYSPEGGEIQVTLSREDGAEGTQWAALRVQDWGLGIPAADLPRIFERFQRGGNVVGRLAGTGMGLWGARQIVEQHGGTIMVESQEGVGTVVTVRLPLEEQGRA